jgi:hypothetical protein
MDNREAQKKYFLAYQAFRLRVEAALKKLESELNTIKKGKKDAAPK